MGAAQPAGSLHPNATCPVSRSGNMQRSVPTEIEGKDAGGALGAAVYNAAKTQVRYSQVPVSATHGVTLLLAKWAEGKQQALEELTPLVYRELRRLAASYLRKERQGHTLQPTAPCMRRTCGLWINRTRTGRTGRISME